MTYATLRAKPKQLLAAALAYARRGWRVIPVSWFRRTRCSCWKRGCPSPGKHPFMENWQALATTDPDIITAWWTKYRHANIGIVTGRSSGVVVLDEDMRNGGDRSLARLKKRFGKLPVTALSISGGGGRHFWFRHPDGDIPWSKSVKHPGLDVLGNGLVIAPPSLHSSGRLYRWARGPELGLAAPPDWMLPPVIEGDGIAVPDSARSVDSIAETPGITVPEGAVIGAPGRRAKYSARWRTALDREALAVRTSLENGKGRNATLFVAALKLGSYVADEPGILNEVEQVLTEAGLTAGLDAREVKDTISSGLSRGMLSPRSKYLGGEA